MGWIAAGGPSKGTWAFYNVTRSAAFWPLLESINITELHPDGIMPMSVNVEDEAGTLTFGHDDECYMSFGGTKFWAGNIKDVGKAMMSEQGPRVWQLTGQDFTAKLDDSVILTAAERPRESIASRIAWILTKLNYGITATNVSVPGEQVEPATYEGMTVREALRQVADEKGLHFYVDFDKDLHMFRSEVVSAPFTLNDTSPDYVSSVPYSEFILPSDSVELTNAVRVHGARVKRWVTDTASIATYGRQESALIDQSLTTTAQVIAAGERRLNQLDEPIIDGSLVCWEPGLRAGMLVTIVNALWSINENYIITQVDISAVGPHDASGDAMLRSEVRFTDRRRVGRFPGSGKDIKDANKPGGPGKTGSGPSVGRGGCCEPIPIGAEPVADWRGCLPYFWADVELIEASGTSHVVTYPSGMSVAKGDRILLWVITSGVALNGPGSQGVPAGYTFITSSVDQALVCTRFVDGTEGSTVNVETAASDDVQIYLAVYRNCDAQTGGNFTAKGAWTWGQQGRVVLFSWAGVNLGDDVTTPPTGSTQRYLGSAPQGSLTWYLGVADRPYAEGQASYPEWGGTNNTYNKNLNLRGVCSGIGTVPAGPTWEGSNEFVDESTSPPTWTVDTSGNLVVTSSVAGSDLWNRVQAPPDLPTQLADWTIRQDFTLDEAGSLTDIGERYIAFFVNIDGVGMGFMVRLGDAVRAPGVMLSGDSDTYLAKSITPGDLYHFEFRLSDGVAYAKLWNDADPEPDWDITSSDLYTLAEEDSIEYAIRLGNDGGTAQVLTLPPFTVSGGALVGEMVARHQVTYGDLTEYPYVSGTLTAWVDHQPVPVIEDDPATGAWSLTTAPYTDPADPTGNAIVEIAYKRAS